MPVRSLNSSVFKWPDRETVVKALGKWAEKEIGLHPAIFKLGYFGSYARGDWGVGSDLDLIAIIKESKVAFEKRPMSWNLEPFPVPAELIVYTQNEWRKLKDRGGRFIKTIEKEVVWIYSKDIK